MIGFWVIVSIVLAALCLGIIGYVRTMHNTLAHMRNAIHHSWNNVETFLTHHSNEIPEIIETAGEFIKREKHLINNIARYRANLIMTRIQHHKLSAHTDMCVNLKELFRVSQRYSKLASNEQFQQMQRRIDSIERELHRQKHQYNVLVHAFNHRISSFPDAIIARWIKLAPEHQFNV